MQFVCFMKKALSLSVCVSLSVFQSILSLLRTRSIICMNISFLIFFSGTVYLLKSQINWKFDSIGMKGR